MTNISPAVYGVPQNFIREQQARLQRVMQHANGRSVVVAASAETVGGVGMGPPFGPISSYMTGRGWTVRPALEPAAEQRLAGARLVLEQINEHGQLGTNTAVRLAQLRTSAVHRALASNITPTLCQAAIAVWDASGGLLANVRAIFEQSLQDTESAIVRAIEQWQPELVLVHSIQLAGVQSRLPVGAFQDLRAERTAGGSQLLQQLQSYPALSRAVAAYGDTHDWKQAEQMFKVLTAEAEMVTQKRGNGVLAPLNRAAQQSPNLLSYALAMQVEKLPDCRVLQDPLTEWPLMQMSTVAARSHLHAILQQRVN